MQLSLQKDFGISNLECSLGFNVNKTNVDKDIRVPKAFEGAEEVIFNREEIGRIEHGQPNYKLSLRNLFDYKKF